MPVGRDEEKKKPVTLSDFNAQAESGAINAMAASVIVVGALKADKPDALTIATACSSFAVKADEFKQNIQDFSSAIRSADPRSLDANTMREIAATMKILESTSNLIPEVTNTCVDVLTEIEKNMNKAPPQQRPAPAAAPAPVI